MVLPHNVNSPKIFSTSQKVEDISLHRECTSYKTDCPWQVSFYLSKNTNLIHLTKLLSQQIIDKIEHYTTNGNLGYNAIQRFWGY
ncbi:hypothetical protein RhiirA4_479757 [Rhizophagus irregularis]|uniref:Uncharacterized protein n=1 Tax=Rhizophagus irregularis TaxID=588596 RepID=A0A2I1HGV6_9GLOM|nr:hypothetical protein RhiirA4_479757 [Rhizophagus irregularis]